MSRPAKVRAFTLLELLVAVTITLFIAAMMLAVTAGMLNLWRRTQASHTQATTAKQVFDLLERDLQSAVYRRDANHWLAADIIDSPGGLVNHGWLAGPNLMKPAAGVSLRPLPPPDANGISRLQDARFGLSGIWLRFVTTNVESGGSLPTVVAYQMIRRPVTGDPLPTNPAPIRYSLYRSAVSNAEAFAKGYDVTSANYASSGITPPSMVNAYRQAQNVTNPSQANLLASNVVDFGCWLYARNPDGTLVRIYPAGVGDATHQSIGSSLAPGSRYPEVVDVMVRILSEEGATLVEAIEASRFPARPSTYLSDEEWWWGVVAAHSKVFTRRVEIKGAAL